MIYVAKNHGRWDVQTNNDTAWVGVDSGGTHHDTNTEIASEFLIQQKGAGGAHIHIGLDEYGNEVFRNER